MVSHNQSENNNKKNKTIISKLDMTTQQEKKRFPRAGIWPTCSHSKEFHKNIKLRGLERWLGG